MTMTKREEAERAARFEAAVAEMVILSAQRNGTTELEDLGILFAAALEYYLGRYGHAERCDDCRDGRPNLRALFQTHIDCCVAIGSCETTDQMRAALRTALGHTQQLLRVSASDTTH